MSHPAPACRWPRSIDHITTDGKPMARGLSTTSIIVHTPHHTPVRRLRKSQQPRRCCYCHELIIHCHSSGQLAQGALPNMLLMRLSSSFEAASACSLPDKVRLFRPTVSNFRSDSGTGVRRLSEGRLFYRSYDRYEYRARALQSAGSQAIDAAIASAGHHHDGSAVDHAAAGQVGLRNRMLPRLCSSAPWWWVPATVYHFPGTGSS